MPRPLLSTTCGSIAAGTPTDRVMRLTCRPLPGKSLRVRGDARRDPGGRTRGDKKGGEGVGEASVASRGGPQEVSKIRSSMDSVGSMDNLRTQVLAGQ